MVQQDLAVNSLTHSGRAIKLSHPRMGINVLHANNIEYLLKSLI